MVLPTDMTPATPANTDLKDTPGLEGDIDSLLTKMEQSTNRLSRDVASSTATPGPAHPPPGTPPAPADAIENLDAQLAELTAQLLDNKTAQRPHADEAPAPPPPAEEPAQVAKAEPPPAPAPPVVATPIAAPIAPIAPPAAAVPAVAAGVNASEAESLAKPLVLPKRPGVALRLCVAASSPLAARSPAVRATVGLLAINTLLIAGAVWVFLMLRPAPQQEESKAFDLGSATLPRPKIEKEASKPAHAEEGKGDAHGKTDSHGKAEAKPPAKKTAAKKKPAPADEGHH